MTADTRKAKDIRRLVSTIPHGVKGLDPRTKLVIIIITSALCLMARGEAIVLAIAAAAFTLAAASGSERAAAMALAARRKTFPPVFFRLLPRFPTSCR